MLSWGNASDGQLGLGGIEDSFISKPRWNKHIGCHRVLDLGCGLKHTVVLLKGGEVRSFGSNEKGQLGQDKSATRPGPITQLKPPTVFVRRVICGYYHTIVLDERGRVYSWGDGQLGQLGLDAVKGESSTIPRLVTELEEHVVIQVACGGNHNLALTQDCKIYSWGQNNHHQLGLETDRPFVGRPTLIPSLSSIPVVHLSAGRGHNVVVTRGGYAFSWGRNTFGQLGVGTLKDNLSPCQVSALDDEVVRYAACGDEHSAFLTEDGKLFTCGSSRYGQLGHGSLDTCDIPMLVQGLVGKEVCQVSCGRMHTAVVVAPGGEIFSCGLGLNGQLGTGEKKNRSEPTLISLGDPPKISLPSWNITNEFFTKDTPVDPVEEGSDDKSRYLLWRLYAGGDQTFATVGITTVDEEAVVQAAPSFDSITPAPGPSTQSSSDSLTQTSPTQTSSTQSFTQTPKIPTASTQSSTGTPDLQSSGSQSSGPSTDSGPSTVQSLGAQTQDSSTGGPSTQTQNSSVGSRTSSSQLLDSLAQTPSTSTISNPPTKATPTSDSPLVDVRVLDDNHIPLFLTNELIYKKLKCDELSLATMQTVITVLDMLFASPGCVNGSLLQSNRRCTDSRPAVDVVSALNIFRLLRERLRPEDLEAKKLLLYHMLHQLPMDDFPCDSNLARKLISEMFPALSLNPCGAEGLRVFYILPAYMMKPARRELITVYMKKFLELDKKSKAIVLEWFYGGPVDYVILIIVCMRKLLHLPTFKLKEDNSKHNNPNIESDQELLRTALRFMRILHEMNVEKNEPISYDQWHYPHLTDIIDLQQDFADWVQNKGGEVIVLCEYAFVLDARAKSSLMQLECVLQMRTAITEAYSLNFQSLFTHQTISDMSPESFVLNVDRKNIVDSTVHQLIQANDADLKKPLKIEFLGEEGEDEGGVAKEYFMLLSQQILNPDFGMFVEDEESHLLWFRDGETLFYEKLDYYIIIGILCGLAIYNSIAVYLPFPIALYKKLLQRPPSHDDFKEMFPALGRSIQCLIDYNEDDFEEKFHLNFTVTRREFGELKVKELIENGAHTPVTKENKHRYMYLFMKYYLIDSINEQFKAFKSGFNRVCNGRVLGLLHPRELMSLVVGMQVRDWDDIKKHIQYRNGYSADHPSIVMFWEIFDAFSEDTKKQFLIFLTGTNRIPIRGFEKMGVTIQKMDGGEGFEKLPVAHTCFNILDLPAYPTKEKMRDKLLQAMNFTAGFGII